MVHVRTNFHVYVHVNVCDGMFGQILFEQGFTGWSMCWCKTYHYITLMRPNTGETVVSSSTILGHWFLVNKGGVSDRSQHCLYTM